MVENQKAMDVINSKGVKLILCGLLVCIYFIPVFQIANVSEAINIDLLKVTDISSLNLHSNLFLIVKDTALDGEVLSIYYYLGLISCFFPIVGGWAFWLYVRGEDEKAGNLHRVTIFMTLFNVFMMFIIIQDVSITAGLDRVWLTDAWNKWFLFLHITIITNLLITRRKYEFFNFMVIVLVLLYAVQVFNKSNSLLYLNYELTGGSVAISYYVTMMYYRYMSIPTAFAAEILRNLLPVVLGIPAMIGIYRMYIRKNGETYKSRKPGVLGRIASIVLFLIAGFSLGVFVFGFIASFFDFDLFSLRGINYKYVRLLNYFDVLKSDINYSEIIKGLIEQVYFVSICLTLGIELIRNIKSRIVLFLLGVSAILVLSIQPLSVYQVIHSRSGTETFESYFMDYLILLKYIGVSILIMSIMKTRELEKQRYLLTYFLSGIFIVFSIGNIYYLITNLHSGFRLEVVESLTKHGVMAIITSFILITITVYICYYIRWDNKYLVMLSLAALLVPFYSIMKDFVMRLFGMLNSSIMYGINNANLILVTLIIMIIILKDEGEVYQTFRKFLRENFIKFGVAFVLFFIVIWGDEYTAGVIINSNSPQKLSQFMIQPLGFEGIEVLNMLIIQVPILICLICYLIISIVEQRYKKDDKETLISKSTLEDLVEEV